ncbi:MAG: hypothetical protein HGB08_03540 [Candidatus Moranbacteria bacterium]|nr:hypothetical protein [Candidatus Moranbacteria bacterium]
MNMRMEGSPIYSREKNAKHSPEEGEDVPLKIIDQIIEEKNRPISPIFDFSDRREINRMESSIERVSEYDETLKKILERYGVHADVRKVGENLFEIPIRSKHGFDNLEDRYAYKGGVARAILLKELGIDKDAEARDIDIAKVVNEEQDERDESIAKKYSEEDFLNGHGIEKLEQEYFETRDFTMNEVLVYDGRIYLTKQCLLDTVRRIIRFADFEKKELRYPPHGNEDGFFVKDKLMAKALRFVADEISRGRKMEIADVEAYEYLDINDFHIALHLDRALGQGYQVAVEYVQLLKDSEQLPGYEGSPEDILRELVNNIKKDGSFVFRFAPDRIFQADAGIMRDLDSRIDENNPAERQYATYKKYEEYDQNLL